MTHSSSRATLAYYLNAKETVIASGFADEIDHLDLLRTRDLTEEHLMAEAAWVVLCSGFRASVVTAKFAAVSAAFFGWRSASEIVARADECVAKALLEFGNYRKIRALVGIAERVDRERIGDLQSLPASEMVKFCESLPYVGPVTAYHLTRNLGFDVAKPDRHLVRTAANLGFARVDDLCRAIAIRTGDRIAVVDAVLWRYAVLCQGGLIQPANED